MIPEVNGEPLDPIKYEGVAWSDLPLRKVTLAVKWRMNWSGESLDRENITVAMI